MTRRQLLAAGALGAARASADAPPNVMFVICDQMRADALGCSGNRNARTPNLDRMAKGGVLFENCYSNNPVCVPSRKSMFTGLYPHQHRSLTNDHDKFLAMDGSLIDRFRRKGYRTGYVGKNHTFTKEAMSGVDFASVRDREKFRAYSPDVAPHWHKTYPVPETQSYAHLNTEDAIRFLDSNPRHQRFFLTVSYFDPHPPFFAPARFVDGRAASRFEIPRYVAPAGLSPRLGEHARAMGFDRLTEPELRAAMQHYHAAVEWGVDAQIGRLLQALEDKGLAKDTVVVFVSDHGDFMGNYRMVRKGMFLQEALLHVPTIWYAPGRIAAGLRVKTHAQLVDLFPTLADLCGDRPPDGLEGVSLKPLLRGGNGLKRDATFASAGYGEIDFGSLHDRRSDRPLHTRVFDQEMVAKHRTAMIRTPEWKLILNETRGPELYRLDGTRHETKNVADAGAHAAVRRELESRLTRWWRW